MADLTVSIVMRRVTVGMEQQIRDEVKLVRGVEMELLNRICNTLAEIRNVLYDYEERRFKEITVDNWLSRLEQICRDIEDVLDEWGFAILKLKRVHEFNDAAVAPYKKKVRSFTRSSYFYIWKSSFRRYIAKKIRNVKAQLDYLSRENEKFGFHDVMPEPTADHTWRPVTSHNYNPESRYGRDYDMDNLVGKLASSVSEQEINLQILSIVGIGGIGKTTLAQQVYNHPTVVYCFESRIWISVSDPFDEARIAKTILRIFAQGGIKDLNLDLVYEHLRGYISGTKFLLVLDDVWTENYNEWERLIMSLNFGGAGSKILVTTRNEMVATTMGTMQNEIYRLGQLSEEDCWFLLRDRAHLGSIEEEFESIGKKIAKKCNGLPLAAIFLGKTLRFKNTLESWQHALNTEIWELERSEEEIFSHLFLSYAHWSPIVKHLFSYCAIFPRDSFIEVEKLIEKWIALGYLGSNVGSGSDMELRGREYFNILLMHSLFHDFQKSNGQIKKCKMNGILHDLAQFLRKRRNTSTKMITCQVCHHLSVDLKVQRTVYRSLFWDDDHSSLTICGCLRNLRVLRTRCKLQSIPQGVEKLVNLTWLELNGNKLSREDIRNICRLNKLQFLRFCAQEVPSEIGYLVCLRLLDLSFSGSLEELPESICDLIELQTLNIKFCPRLSKLPQGIDGLINLKHLLNSGTRSLKQFSEGLARIGDLRTLTEYCGGCGWSKLEWLKDLNKVSGFLSLKIRLAGGDDDLAEVVNDAQKAELRNKENIDELQIIFEDEIDEKEETSLVRLDILGDLEPHQHLQKLLIWFYKGSKLPDWFSSPLKRLKSINLYSFIHLSSLPALGKLPCLEEIYMSEMHGLQFVGRELLGITAGNGGTDIESSSSSVSPVGFPKLKELAFNHCPEWKEWEDITAEEEESAAVSLMPCLTKLTIIGCQRLNALPHRLLRKASSLHELNIVACSTKLQQHSHGDKDA